MNFHTSVKKIFQCYQTSRLSRLNHSCGSIFYSLLHFNVKENRSNSLKVFVFYLFYDNLEEIFYILL